MNSFSIITISDIRYYTLLSLSIILLIVLLIALIYLIRIFKDRTRSVNFQLPSLDEVETKPIKQSKEALKMLNPNEKQALEHLQVDLERSNQLMDALIKEYEKQSGKQYKNGVVLPDLVVLQFNDKKGINTKSKAETLAQAMEEVDKSFSDLMEDI